MNVRRITSILLIAIMAIGVASAQETVIETVQLPILKDASINKKDSTFNFGNSWDLIAMAWTCNSDDCVMRSLIDFDFSSLPADAQLLDARLSFYASEGSGNPQHFGFNDAYLMRVTEDWDELGVTWIDQPATTTVDRYEITESTSPDQNYEDLDVFNLVQDMIDNPSTSHGFMLELQSENIFRSLNFASGNHTNAALHPVLELTYETAVEDTGSVGTNIADIVQPGSVEIYPNPVTEYFNVRFFISEPVNYELTLRDISGTVVKKIGHGQQSVGEINYTVHTANEFDDGLYFLVFEIDGEHWSRKLILQN